MSIYKYKSGFHLRNLKITGNKIKFKVSKGECYGAHLIKVKKRKFELLDFENNSFVDTKSLIIGSINGKLFVFTNTIPRKLKDILILYIISIVSFNGELAVSHCIDYRGEI